MSRSANISLPLAAEWIVEKVLLANLLAPPTSCRLSPIELSRGHYDSSGSRDKRINAVSETSSKRSEERSDLKRSYHSVSLSLSLCHQNSTTRWEHVFCARLHHALHFRPSVPCCHLSNGWLSFSLPFTELKFALSPDLSQKSKVIISLSERLKPNLRSVQTKVKLNFGLSPDLIVQLKVSVSERLSERLSEKLKSPSVLSQMEYGPKWSGYPARVGLECYTNTTLGRFKSRTNA